MICLGSDGDGNNSQSQENDLSFPLKANNYHVLADFGQCTGEIPQITITTVSQSYEDVGSTCEFSFGEPNRPLIHIGERAT